MILSDDQDFKIQVDGQILDCPSAKNLNELLNNPNYFGLPVYLPGMEGIIKNLILFVLENSSQFRIGLYHSTRAKKAWHVIPLFDVGGNFQRVQIEFVACKNCDWRGLIANPTEPSLYFGVPEELAATQRAYSLSRLSCPVCGTNLPRFAIWIGEKNRRIDGT